MATINFLYRSTKDEAPLNVRLLFRHDSVDYVIGGKTKLWVSKHYWSKQHNIKHPRDIDVIKTQDKVNSELFSLRKHILDNFYQTSTIGKDKKRWLKNVIDNYYDPKNLKEIPDNLTDFIDHYIEHYKINKGENTKSASITKFKVIKHKIEHFEDYHNRTVFIKEVNSDFKREFIEFCRHKNYAQGTIKRELGLIKTFCRLAMEKGKEVSPDINKLSNIELEDTYKIFLSFEEIGIIEKAKLKHDYLENARDWLIISCYCGQRISDFMKFKKRMIVVEDDKHLIEFIQKKTGNKMTIPLHPKIIKILEKRNGEFPRAISNQRYNDYIKIVCKEAGLSEMIEGSIQKNISKDKKKTIMRSVKGIYPKHELITSHIGRRSFSSNFYGKIPTPFLIHITGHSTESLFLDYIGKSDRDLAKEIVSHFKKSLF